MHVQDIMQRDPMHHMSGYPNDNISQNCSNHNTTTRKLTLIHFRYRTFPSPQRSAVILLPSLSLLFPFPRHSLICGPFLWFSYFKWVWYKWNYIVCNILGLAFFTWHNSLEIHSRCCGYDTGFLSHFFFGVSVLLCKIGMKTPVLRSW